MAYILVSFLLSGGIAIYYAQIHFHLMNPHPRKLTGFSAITVAHMIGLPAVYLFNLIWQSQLELSTIFQPSAKKISWALVVFLLTPLLNMGWIPFQVWLLVPLTIFGKASTSLVFLLILCIAFASAYIVVCLVRASGMRIVGSVFAIAIYLLMVFAIETLFFGMTYI